jgi:hypothetical protein
VSQEFTTTNLPPLATGLTWLVNYDNPTFVQLSVIEGMPGDFNQDETVDAADYVVWRKLGSPAEYNIWRTHFAETVGVGAGATVELSHATVPEPTAAGLCCLALLTVIGMRRVASRNDLGS